MGGAQSALSVKQKLTTSNMKKSEREDSLTELLKNQEDSFFKKLFEEEGITKEDLEFVDLEINFSPVIPYKGDRPVEVIETIGGNYIVPGVPHTVTPLLLKIMRYRYLSNRKNPFI